MSKLKKCIAALMTSAGLICTAPIICHAVHSPIFDEHIIELEYNDAPEGTAYLDVLVRMDKSDEHYSYFNQAPKTAVDKKVINGNTQYVYEELPIDENSEIAQYNNDGFISLTIHSDKVNSFELLKAHGYGADYIKLNCFADELYNDFGNAEGFRLAYVSDKGEVLMTTKSVPVTYGSDEPYAFVANGVDAQYRSCSSDPLGNVVTGSIIILAVVGIIMLTVGFLTGMIRFGHKLKQSIDENDI